MMSVLKILLALGLLASARAAPAPRDGYRDELLARARELRLAERPKWLRLLHFKGRRSEADGAAFFLSPRGRRDPAAELEADLSAFFEPPPAQGQPAQCRFPARYRWLKAQLAFDAARLPERPCPDFEAWRDAIDADAVTLVFASAFLNNPASMYGHTFLRLHRRGGADPLLDYSINFEATPDTSNALMYTLKGLNGSFKGEYSLQPFYMKTSEYSSLEMRDLWDYPLNLSPVQIEELVRHGWEMGSTHFNYYFFSKNCSYQLLTLLEAAVDDLDVSSSFIWAVKPADTVRLLLAKPGLVGTPVFRPSFVSEIKARRARLDAQETSAATALGRGVSPRKLEALASYPKERQALILESANDYLRYRSGFYLAQSSATLDGIHALLRARGRLGLPPAEYAVPRPEPLEAGHASARAGAGFGSSRRSSFEELELMPALHDLVSSDDGYIPDSQLEMLAGRLRYDNQARELYVERFDLANIVSLSPLDPWVRTPSWKLSAGVDQAKELGCSGASCMYFDVGAGGGYALGTRAWRRELLFALAEADFGFGPVLPQDWRAGAGGSAGVLLELTGWWRLLGKASYIDYAQRSSPRQRLRVESSFKLAKDAELRVTADRRVPDEEVGGMLYLYF